MKLKFPKINYHKIIHHSAVSLDVLFLLFALAFYFGYLADTWAKFGAYSFYLIVAINTLYFASKINQIPEEEREDSKMIYYFSHFFLLTLIIIVVNQFVKKQFITNNMPYLTAISIALGFLTFYAYRNKVESEIEEEKEAEEEKEKKRAEEFDHKFPRINKIWGLRRFVRWMYKEGWGISGFLILVTLLILLVLLSNLGAQYLWTDEAISFKVSSLIIEKGRPIFENGESYYISPVYHYMNASFMALFGQDEFGSRLINIISIAIISFLLYISLKEKNKVFAIYSSILYLLININITMVRETRMYSLFTALFFIIIVLFAHIYKRYEKTKRLRSLLFGGILFLILFYLTYHTHGFLIFFLLSLPLFFLICFLKSPNKKDLIFLGVSSLLILFLVYIKFNTLNIFNALTNRTTLDWAEGLALNPQFYLDILTKNLKFFFIVPLLGTISLFSFRDKKMTISYSIVFITLFIISYQLQKELRYVYFLMPLIVLIFSDSFYYLTKIFNKKHFKFIFSIILIFLLFFQLSLFYEEYFELNKNSKHPLAEHKKLEFKEAISCAREILASKPEVFVIADYQSALTLDVYDIRPDYILLPKGNFRLNNGELEEKYFGIPYLAEDSEEFSNILTNKDVLFIRREFWIFRDMKNDLSFDFPLYRPRISSNFNGSFFCK